MRFMSTIILSALFFATACSNNTKQASQSESHTRSSLVLKQTQADGSETRYEESQLDNEETAIGLELVFDIFKFVDSVPLECDSSNACQPRDQASAQEKICYEGDIGEVCSLLSKMAKFSADKYVSGGDHQITRLQECKILAGGKSVQANVEMASDFETQTVHLAQQISACSGK